MKMLMAFALFALFFLPQPVYAQPQVCFDKTCFEVELAQNEMERIRGQQQRPSLAQNVGMLFIFDTTDIRRFWMKETLIPLDMIWIDEDLNVVDITHDAQPCEADPCVIYGPDIAIRYVLEINAGLAQEKGIEVGEKVHFVETTGRSPEQN